MDLSWLGVLLCRFKIGYVRISCHGFFFFCDDWVCLLVYGVVRRSFRPKFWNFDLIEVNNFGFLIFLFRNQNDTLIKRICWSKFKDQNYIYLLLFFLGSMLRFDVKTNININKMAVLIQKLKFKNKYVTNFSLWTKMICGAKVGDHIFHLAIHYIIF